MSFCAASGRLGLVGASFFVAFVGPKGNVNIYDPTKNATATVSGVPDGIVIVAKLASDIQGIGVTIADASSPRLYEDTANGSMFDLVRASIGGADALSSQFLLESTKEYFIKCARPATTRVSSGLTIDEIKKTSTDLMVSFAKAADDAHFSIVYTAADPAGTAFTCNNAWGLIQPQIAAAATYAAYEDAICTQADFDASDANQKARCQVIMDEIPAELFKQTGATDRFTYLRAAGLAFAMEEALRDINPERAIAADTNRRFMEQGAGFFVIANEYGPFMRAAFLAAALGTLPLLFLFLPTPYFVTVVRLFIGFFAFVTLWSVIDVGLAQIAHGIAVDAFADVTTGALAYDDLMLRPPASAKALAVFGTTRFIAISFSALFVVTIFKLSGASFAAMTGGMQSTATGTGDAAANAVMNPVGRMNTASANASASGRGSMLGGDNESFGDFRDMHAGDIASGIGRVRGVNSRMGEGSYASAMGAQGAVGGLNAAAAAGDIDPSSIGRDNHGAVSEGETAALARVGEDRGAMQSAGGFGSAQAKWEVAKGLAKKNGTDPMSEALKLGHMGGYGEVVRAASAESVGVAEQSMRVGADREVGGNLGFGAGASAIGSSAGKISRAAGAIDAAYQSGDQQYLEQTGGSDLQDIAGAGMVRRSRQAGGYQGLESASQSMGVPAAELAGRAEGTNTARNVIFAARHREIGEQLAGDPNSFFAAQAGSNITVTPTGEEWDQLRSDGAIGAQAYEVGRNNGGDLTASISSDGKIQNYHVGSRESASHDESMTFRGGESIHAAPEISGGTLHNMAYGGMKGRAQFTQMAEQYEASGQGHALRDIVAVAGADHLSGLSGDEMSRSETGSVSANASAFAQASAGGGFSAGIINARAEAGVRGSLDSSDGREARHSETANANVLAVQGAYDRTIGNDNLGAMETRTDAFLNEYRGLDLEAHERQNTVHEHTDDPDGIIGGAPERFQSIANKFKSEPISTEDFEELKDRSRHPRGYDKF